MTVSRRRHDRHGHHGHHHGHCHVHHAPRQLERMLQRVAVQTTEASWPVTKAPILQPLHLASHLPPAAVVQEEKHEQQRHALPLPCCRARRTGAALGFRSNQRSHQSHQTTLQAEKNYVWRWAGEESGNNSLIVVIVPHLLTVRY